jgi:hypothetical protein
MKLDPDRTHAQVDGLIPIEASGWCVLRAFSDKAEYPVLDLYPYATTSPIYVNVPGAPLHSPADAAYFVAWMDRLIVAARSNTSWNTDAEKKTVLDLLDEAKQKYEALAR